MIEMKKVLIGVLNTLQKKPAKGSNTKPPILLVHGAWHGAWCWQETYLDYFAEAGHETWAMDLRGHGDSGNTKPFRFTTIGDYIKDVMDVIAEMPSAPIVIGHSMGGFVCQHLLNKDVNIKGLGLLASLPHYGVSGAKLTVHPLQQVKSSLTWSLYPLVSDPENAQTMFLEPDADQKTVDRLINNLGDEAYFAFFGMLIFTLPKKPQSTNNTPICVIGGGADKTVAVEHQEKLAVHLEVQAHILEGEPHNLMMSKNWQKSADIFLEWIESITTN